MKLHLDTAPAAGVRMIGAVLLAASLALVPATTASASTGASASTPAAPATTASAGAHPALAADLSTAPAHPFGSHPLALPAGAAHAPGTVASADAATLAAYKAWKSHYLVAGCGSGRYYVDSSSSTSASGSRVVSEGQGYGMVIVALMAGADSNARTEFDGLYRYATDHPSEGDPGLMAWHQNASCDSTPGDAGSATDGDLDIAYGLLLADAQWGSAGSVDYRAAALHVIASIKASEINPTTHLTKLGDWIDPADHAHWYATRSSDFMVDHFAAFERATGDPFWGAVVSATDALITTMQAHYAPTTGLLPDFIVNTNTTPKPAPANFQESAYDGSTYWNACRDPWRLAENAVVASDAASARAATTLATWIIGSTHSDPLKVRAGYKLSGTALATYADPAFTAPFAAAAVLGSANQAWLDAAWATFAGHPAGYFSDTVALQSMLLISGIDWMP